ncbi:MAG: ATP-binding protein [Oligoflexales bacterium]
MSTDLDDDELVFLEEDQSEDHEISDIKWNILIVDDEEQVHLITKLALKNYQYDGKHLNISSVFNSEQAKNALQQENDFALILLDVVMEERNSGLKLVKFIRDELKNNMIRIILRTGQPGDAPEEKVITEFDIDEYKLKTELTHTKMFTTMTVALRSYDRIIALRKITEELHSKNMQLASFNQELEKKVEERTIELKKINQELESAANEKRNLIRILSHDLNNYINVIFTAVALSAKYAAETPEKILGIMDKIKRAADNQSKLISHIVEIDAIDSGKKPIDLKPVSLLKTYEQGEFVFRDRLDTKNISLFLECSADNPVVLADPIVLTNSIFNNILSNAIKFSPEGGKIKVKISSHSPNKLCMSIQDQGIGIPKSLQNNIFSGERVTTRLGTAGEKGTGFGMPLVKTYVERFGGTVVLESTEESESSKDHGTCFHVILNEAKQ